MRFEQIVKSSLKLCLAVKSIYISLSVKRGKMPKRKCPFEDDFVQQSKVHLTKKSYEKTSVKAMENIWNKTRDLLFEGAKKDKEDGKNEIMKNICEQCDFCLKDFQSLNDCRSCHQSYCSDCSLPSYEGDLTEFICLSCV